MSDVDPNHWTSWTDTPPPCSHSEPGVAEAMALARAEVSERLPLAQKPCPFCEIVAGRAPAQIVHEWPEVIAIIPLNPVTSGHTLVIPRAHVADALTDPIVTATTMQRASEWTAQRWPHANILTSIGKPATQSVFHLHIHVVPRAAGDQLMLPWGTTGNPHDPHWCKVAQGLQDQLDRATQTKEPSR